MMTHFFANTLYIHELKCCSFPKLIAKTQDQLENKPLSNDRLKVTIFHTRFSIIFTLLYWWPDAHPRQHSQITSLYMMTHFFANKLYIHELQYCSFPKLIAKTQDQLENKPLSNDRLKVTIFHTRFSIIFTLLYWWPDAHPRQHTQITSLYMMTHFFANTLYIHELQCCLFPKLIAKTQDQLENKLLSYDRLKVTIFHTRFSIIFTLLYWWPDAHPRQHTQITSLYMMTHFFANKLYIHELQCCSFPKLIAKTQDQLENKRLSNDRLKVTIFHTRFSIIFTLLYWWPDAHPRQHTQITSLYMMTNFFANTLYIHELQ